MPKNTDKNLINNNKNNCATKRYTTIIRHASSLSNSDIDSILTTFYI